MAKNLAIFSAQFPPHMGGIENFTRNLARALANRGNAVTVVTNDTNSIGIGWDREDNFDVLRLPCVPLVDGRLPLPKPSAVRRELLKELDAREFDGVLVNARFYPHSLLGMKTARAKGLAPLVLDHGSAYLSFSNPVLDPCVRVYEHVMTTLGKRYKPRYFGISHKSVEWLRTFGIEAEGVISNSIDAAEFRECASKRDFRTELELDEDDFLVAFVGRFIPEKGLSAIIEASRTSELSNRHVVFALAGDGPLADEVKAAEGPNLCWMGRLGKDDVSALLQQSDALCLPSRSEGFSTTLLEAGACGCPAVVTDIGGARELIPDEHYGTIIQSREAAAVISALAFVVDNRSVLLEQSQNCRRQVDGKFSWDKSALQVEEYLTK
ncbi:glycosyltransferase family 4 protein [Paratractidigestivibacter faecalis]|uniref:glycosyltransferase family 4 protein n=1 Tax=Paratractidigestivibacter faecalis TaxID=2292441 RepID=UPI0018E57ABF|nr:glycosyltransferase family 4 protein [Paratractidigestivibacter faecalis]